MRLALVALLAVVGCSEPRDLYDPLTAHWTISSEFSDSEIEAILAAADDWSQQTNGQVALTFDVADAKPGRLVISRTDAESDDVAGSTEGGHRNRIEIHPEVAPGERCLRLIAAHELGHTFGINHGGEGIMQARHSRSCEATFTADDLALFADAI